MRQVYYDVTHLRHNARRGATSGIRRVDLEFAAHFLLQRTDVRPVQYGVAGVSPLAERDEIRDLIKAMKGTEASASTDMPVGRIGALLAGERWGGEPSARGADFVAEAITYLRFLTWPSYGPASIKPNSIYLNIAQHALAYGFFFTWLKARPDVRSVFFVHDLLPLDYPEFWRDGYRDLFIKGFNTLAEVGRAFLVSTEAVKDRLQRELRRAGRWDVPILALPFPAFVKGRGPSRVEEAGGGEPPYFVMVGTIEPRKNHLLMLNIWRRLAEAGGAVPKLVIVGKRGWENEQILDLLDRCTTIRDVVVEVPTITDADMRLLVAHARALLFPSFQEGFGLPLAEALALGTPVVASDIPVLREAAQDKAIFLDPLDGPGWMRVIRALSDTDSPVSAQARALADTFAPMSTDAYFAKVERFVEAL